MRVLALFFLLANLASLAWIRGYANPEAGARRLHDARDAYLGPGLVMVDEGEDNIPFNDHDGEAPLLSLGAVDEPPSMDEQETVTEAPVESAASDALTEEPAVEIAVATADTPDMCVQLGPFSNEDRASVAAVRLQDIGYRPTVRQAGGQILSGFWVYLPPYANRRDAERAVEDLKAKGIDDLFVVTGSGQLNAVSLGLFSRGELADRRAANVGKFGYTPRIAERFRDASVFWVEYRETPDNVLTPEDIGVFANALELPEKIDIPCGGSGDTGP